MEAVTLSDPKIIAFFASKAINASTWVLKYMALEDEVLQRHGNTSEGLSPDWVTDKMKLLVEQSRDDLIRSFRHEQQDCVATVRNSVAAELTGAVHHMLKDSSDALACLASDQGKSRQDVDCKLRELSEQLAAAVSGQSAMNAWLERMNGRQSSDKGKAGEAAYLQLMSKHFIGYPRDVSTVPHSADIEYDEDGRPPLIIEVKNRNTVVPKSHIDKFYADMDTTSRHGILVSLDSNIANRGDFTFEVRPGNLVAFFVANNGFDMHRLRTAMDLVYLVAKHLEDRDDDTTPVSKATLHHVLDSLVSVDNNIKTIKEHTNKSLQILNDTSTSVIRALIKTALTPKETQYKCQFCGKALDNRKDNVERHEAKFCPANPASQKYVKPKKVTVM